MALAMEIVKQIVRSNNGELKSDLKKNIIFSPLSIDTLLGIIACGLKPGPTLEHLLFLLGSKTLDDLNKKATELTAIFPSPKSPDCPVFSSSNCAWIDKKYTLNPNFNRVLQTLYKAESFAVDFENKTREAKDEINSWVEKATKGLIKTVLSEDAVSKNTNLILANAIYFKGLWMDEPFDPSLSRIESFYKLNGETIQVPFISSCDEVFRYVSLEEFKMVRLPYDHPNRWVTDIKGRVFSMYVFLPNKKDGLINLLDQFSSSADFLNLKFEFDPMKFRELRIPKFKFSHKFRLSKTLERLGLCMDLDVDAAILEAFDTGHNTASGGGMQFFHISCIGVDEYGTEAAAFTYEEKMTMSCYPVSPSRVDFIADHPFIFMIREDTSGTPIFLGAVVNPLLD